MRLRGGTRGTRRGGSMASRRSIGNRRKRMMRGRGGGRRNRSRCDEVPEGANSDINSSRQMVGDRAALFSIGILTHDMWRQQGSASKPAQLIYVRAESDSRPCRWSADAIGNVVCLASIPLYVYRSIYFSTSTASFVHRIRASPFPRCTRTTHALCSVGIAMAIKEGHKKRLRNVLRCTAGPSDCVSRRI
jgi:hypothetical protein